MATLCFRKIDYCRNDGGENNPEKLKPVEKRDADERWLSEIVERRPQQHDKREKKKEAEPLAAPATRTCNHDKHSFCHNDYV